MWRDRTNLYISYRQSFAHHPSKKPSSGAAANGYSRPYSEFDERRGLMADADGGGGGGGDAIIEMDLLPPRWVDIQEEVTELLKEAQRKAGELDRLHQKHVLPGFDDDAVKREEEATIERVTREITRSFHACQRAIQRIEAMVAESRRQGGLSKGDETMARNIQVQLATKVQDASASFRKKQSNYLRKLKALDGVSSPLDRPPTQNPYSDPSMLESETDKSFSQSTLQQSQLRRTGNETAIAQREREINDLARGIIELADIFKDLQAMVIDQGTMLDRIDYNVERMAEDVKGAEKELIVATGYQKKTTKRKIIFLLLLVIIGLIILLIVKPKGRSGPPPSNPEPEPPLVPDM